jgi:hypothetical protein
LDVLLMLVDLGLMCHHGIAYHVHVTDWFTL